MGTKIESAVDNYLKGYNCCQAVLCAYCEEIGLKEEDAFKITEGFGSGMGALGDTCGAVTGMFMALSYANSKSDLNNLKATRADTYAKVRKAAELFKQEHTSLYCRELLKEKRENKKEGCAKCVRDAATIVERYLNEEF